MKCYRCKSEWETIKTIKYPVKCPYCGNDLEMLPDESNVIKVILQEKTESIFEDSEAYKGCLQDKLPNAETGFVKCLLRAGEIKLHTYYKYASANASNRTSLLALAKKSLDSICSNNDFSTRIEKMYEKAFLNCVEEKARRDYYDRDHAYLNLAKQLEHQARYTDAFRVLLVSIDAGNDDASDYLCNNLERVRFIDAGLDIASIEKVFNKLLISNKQIDYFKLANLYAYGDFRKLKNSAQKALSLYEADKTTDLAQAEMLIRRYMGYGAEETTHRIDILKQLCQNSFAVQTLYIIDSDCLETSKEFLLSNNVKVNSIAIKLCYQMALYYWNNRDYEKAFLFWLNKCISLDDNSTEFLSIEQIAPIDIGELFNKYRYELPEGKFLFRLIYEYCERNNLYDEGYLYFEFADYYGIDSDYGKASMSLYQSGLMKDGYECFVNLFTKLLQNEEYSSRKFNPKHSNERKLAEKYTYGYILDNILELDLKWIQHSCERLERWKAKEKDKRYVSTFLLDLLTGVGKEYLNQNEFDKSYEMLLSGCRISRASTYTVFSSWIESFYQIVLGDSEQSILNGSKLGYLEKGKELLVHCSNNELKAELLRQLAEEYKALDWNVRFERLYKEAAALGNSIAQDYFMNQGMSILVDQGKLIKWLGNEKTILIPNSVTEIGRNAFEGNCYVNKVVVPDTVRKIGLRAFAACKQLTEIEIQGHIDSICTEAFAGCVNLEKVVFKEPPVYIEPDAFVDTLVIDNSDDVSIVGNVLVGYKGKENTICIQDGIEEIGTSAFENSGIASITFPETLLRIGEYGFSNCRHLKNVVLPAKVRIIDDYAFRSSGVKEISLGSVKKIGKGAFENSKIERVRIPGTVAMIESSLFEFCSDLKEVWIDKGVKKIEEDAFYGCNKLTKVHIPHTVVEIDDNAFEGQQMKIYGDANSYASQYANKMGISFIPV